MSPPGFLYGIAAGGGAGRMMAEWIVEGEPSLDLWPLDVRRFAYHHNTRHFMYPRAIELYGHHYKIAYPGLEHESARGIRRSPLYATLKEKGAVYGSKAGWERPNWFAPSGMEALDKPSFRRPNWFAPVGAEHRAVRERRGADRPDLVQQIRARRQRRAGRPPAPRRLQHGQARGQRHLYPALQRARRDRGRPHHHAPGAGPLLHRHRQRLCRA